MALKQIPFCLETAKKIQNGEEQGKIKTRNGYDVRVICWDKKCEHFPMVCLIKTNENLEYTGHYTEKGTSIAFIKHELLSDLILEIPNDTQEECRFKPFDKVLGRNEDNHLWKPDIFSFYKRDGLYKYRCLGDVFKQCIPYEGNQELVGTTNKPKED